MPIINTNLLTDYASMYLFWQDLAHVKIKVNYTLEEYLAISMRRWFCYLHSVRIQFLTPLFQYLFTDKIKTHVSKYFSDFQPDKRYRIPPVTTPINDWEGSRGYVLGVEIIKKFRISII